MSASADVATHDTDGAPEAAVVGEPARGEARWPFALALGVLLVLGGLAAQGARFQVNPDGICYLQLASYLRDGDVAASISGYWSPLLAWSLTPLLALGVERLLAARLVLLLWSAVGVFATDRLARRLGLAPTARAAALVAVALALGDLATRVIAPDVVVGGCLLLQAGYLLHPDLLARPRVAALAGAWGGVAYLAKSYALPFTLVILPATVGLRWLLRRGEEPDAAAGRPRRIPLRIAGIGLGAAVAVALPWIGALSWRYERPTWTTVGPVARAVTGPHLPPGLMPEHPLEGLRAPPPPHRSVWERPEVLPYPPGWSPFESRALAAHQLRLIVANAALAREFMASWDLVGLTLLALVLAPVIAWALRRRPPRGAPAQLGLWCVWVPATCLVYVGGYVVVYVEERYLRTFVLPLVVLLVTGGASALGAALGRRRGATWPVHLLVVAVCSTFALQPLHELRRLATVGRRVAALTDERLVQPLAALDLRGPAALVRAPGTRSPWREGQTLAFLVDVPYVGSCDAGDAAALSRLDELGVQTVFTLRADEPPTDLGPAWTLRARLPALVQPPARYVDVFVRR